MRAEFQEGTSEEKQVEADSRFMISDIIKHYFHSGHKPSHNKDEDIKD